MTSKRRLTPRPSLADDVYAIILDVLISQEMEPNQQFNIDAFARTIGVSPTPVREALTRAESDGLVIKQPLRGFTVAPLLTREEAAQMAEIRGLLEPWAAARAAEHAGPEDKDRLLELAEVAQLTDSTLAYREDMLRDATFHDAIWELAGNPFIRDALNRLHCHLHMYRLQYSAELRELAYREHRAIAEAIAAGDNEQARNAMATHISVAWDRLDAAQNASET